MKGKRLTTTVTVFVLAMFASLLVTAALAKPNEITVIVKLHNHKPVTSPIPIQIFDSEILGEPNWLLSTSTDAEGRLLIINDGTYIPGKTYLVVWTDFETIGSFKVSKAGSAHVTVYLPDWFGV